MCTGSVHQPVFMMKIAPGLILKNCHYFKLAKVNVRASQIFYFLVKTKTMSAVQNG